MSGTRTPLVFEQDEEWKKSLSVAIVDSTSWSFDEDTRKKPAAKLTSILNFKKFFFFIRMYVKFRWIYHLRQSRTNFSFHPVIHDRSIDFEKFEIYQCRNTLGWEKSRRWLCRLSNSSLCSPQIAENIWINSRRVKFLVSFFNYLGLYLLISLRYTRARACVYL